MKLTLCFFFSRLRWVVLWHLSETLYWQLRGLKSYIQKANWVLRTDAMAELFVLSHWPTSNCSKVFTAFTSEVNLEFQHLMSHQLCHILTHFAFFDKIHSVLSKYRFYNLRPGTGRRERHIMQKPQGSSTASISLLTMVKNPNVSSLIQILDFLLQPPVALVPHLPATMNNSSFYQQVVGTTNRDVWTG